MDQVSLLNKTLGILDNQAINVNHLILRAHQLGIRVSVYADQKNRAFLAADNVVTGALNDKVKLKQFADQCQWVIYANTVGVSGALVNYLSQFTKVPQGSDALDLINDQSILHVFLETLNVNQLPSSTVFNLADVKQAMTKMRFPVFLRPVQTDVLKNREFLVTDESQFSQLKSLFNGEAYLLEALPHDARYFDLTLFKTANQATVSLPLVENHYQGSTFDFANLNPELSPETNDQFRKVAHQIASHLNYTGGLTISFILTKDHQILVNGLGLPFNLENNVFNQTSDDVAQILLKTVLNLNIQRHLLHRAWLLKSVGQKNSDRAQQLWSTDDSIFVDLSSLGNGHSGYALISAKSLQDAKAKLQASQL